MTASAVEELLAFNIALREVLPDARGWPSCPSHLAAGGLGAGLRARRLKKR
jgi:hypothetical protein